MSGIPWPSEVLSKLNDPLHAAFNSPVVLEWVLPLLAWIALVFFVTMFILLFRFRAFDALGSSQLAKAEYAYQRALALKEKQERK